MSHQVQSETSVMFPPHLLWRRLLCLCEVQQVGKVDGCLQGEVRDSQRRCDTAFLFHVFSSRQPVLVETNHLVSFSFPDLCAVPVSLQGSSSLDQTFCFSFFRTDQVDVRLVRWTNSHLQNDVAFPNGLLVWCQTNWMRLWVYLMFSYW